MKHRHGLAVCSLGAALVWACLGMAQPPEKGEAKDRGTIEVPLPLGTGKDPTVPTPRMRETMGGIGKPAPSPGSPAAPKMPGMSLRARVIRKGQTPAALLEVDGRLYTITAGSLIASGGVTMKVLEVNANEVRIEMAPMKETVVLR